MHSLPLFHRIAGERVILVGTGDIAEAKRRLIERAGGLCCGINEPARLGFVALADRDEAAAVVRALKARGILVNVADRPELCDFTLPSILERGEVMVAVGTGGASAGLAKQLRLRIEGLLPTSLAALADGLKNARERLRARWPDPAERRHALDRALAQDGPLDPFDPDAAIRLPGWLDSPEPISNERSATIMLTSVDPDDLTLRQARLLGAADTIVHDRDVPSAILARARADAVRQLSGTAAAKPTHGLTVTITLGRPAADGQTALDASLPNSSK